MKKILFSLILGFIFQGQINAQEILDNEFVVNPYIISPSNSGYNGSHELFVGALVHFAGVPNAPISAKANYNGILKGNSGIGAQLKFDKFGAFNNFNFNLSYAYHLQLAAHRLSLGLAFEANQTSLNFYGSNSDPLNDAGLNSDALKSGVTFNAGVGVTYAFKGLMLSVAMPRIVPNKMSKLTLYSQGQMLRYYAAYNFNINHAWSLKPYIVIDHYLVSRIVYEGLISVKYKNLVWLNLGYGNDYTISGGLGVLAGKRITAQYTFKYTPNGIYKGSAGGHELTLGFLIGKNNNKYLNHSTFNTNSKAPYYDWE